jgi:hypothetical protein
MHRIISVYGRKFLSIALIFNALLTITYAVGLLYGFYVEHWTLYPPFLINGNLFWLVIAAAVLNIFPAAYVGKVHTGRLWFHHYVYGIFVIILSVIWIIFGTPFSILTVFFINTTDLSANVGRFFFLGGLTLLLDDLPDVHQVTFRGLQWLKCKAHQARRFLNAVQLILGVATFFIFLTVCLSIATKPQWITPANLIQMGTLLITAFSCFASVKGKIWNRIDPKKQPPPTTH